VRQTNYCAACRQADHPSLSPTDEQWKVICYMYLSLYIERRDVVEAEALMDKFGTAAGIEAAERADASRNIGNHLHYCRWRQIERLIIVLSVQKTLGTVH